MYGSPDLAEDFAHLPYANPKAPKGGTLILGESGGFDSLNPYILKGRAPGAIRAHVMESLMGRNWNEPFSLYGLLAESIETDPNRDWVAFTLRKEARFSDGSPVTVEDVIWSFTTLAEKGHPRYVNAWKKVKAITQTGPRTVKITFNTVDRELPLILGLRPVLRKADWDGRAFEESSLDKITGSGPYIIADFEPNRFIHFARNPDYWGNDLPFNRGRHNLDGLRYEYFSDSDVVFEAFKAGELNFFRETNAGKWETHYTFPDALNGQVKKSLIAHQRPSGIRGFVMNTRRAPFDDIRVRDALIHAFNYEFINQTLNGTPQSRITSYFSNSFLAMHSGPAVGKVHTLLQPFAADLPSDTLLGYTLPVSDGTKRNRRNLRKAQALLEQAGWSIKTGRLVNEKDMPFKIEVLLRSGETANEAIINLYADALKRLGISVDVVLVDNAQYTERTNTYDFDMTFYQRALSLSPGNEQRLYWGKEGVTKPGTRNYMGVDSPAVDAMIDYMLAATDPADFTAAVKALDRILTAGRYVIPLWHFPESRLAHSADLHFPKTLPLYGDWSGFLPDVWWAEKAP